MATKTLEERSELEQGLLKMPEAAFEMLRSEYRMRSHRAELIRAQATLESDDANQMLRIMHGIAEYKERTQHNDED